jgi:hypothetical protein
LQGQSSFGPDQGGVEIMTIYLVHVPIDSAGSANAGDGVHFERQAFAWPAFLFGPVWLLVRGLWRAFVAWCVVAALIVAAATFGYLSTGAAIGLFLLLALYLGLEGRAIAAAAFERAGWRFADVAIGANRASAERDFFSRWAAEQPQAPSRRPPPTAPQSPSVIGLFPEAGG